MENQIPLRIQTPKPERKKEKPPKKEAKRGVAIIDFSIDAKEDNGVWTL